MQLGTSCFRGKTFLGEGVEGVRSYEKGRVSQLRRDSSGDSVPVDAAGAGAAGAAVDDDASQIGRLGVAW